MGALTTAIITPETIPMTLNKECVLNDEVAYGTNTCVVLLSSEVIVAIRKILLSQHLLCLDERT